MAIRAFPALLALVASGLPATAQMLDLPQPSQMTSQHSETLGSFSLPVGAFRDGAIPALQIEGMVEQTAWRIADPALTTLQLLVPLRAQLAQQGFVTLFECETTACGGFDFRYGISVLPEPAMHVDLGDFRFLSARRDGPAGAEHLALLVSHSSGGGYLQISRIGPAAAIGQPIAIATSGTAVPPVVPPVTAPPAAAATAAPADLAGALQGQGFVVLEGLEFATGAATLTQTDLPALRDLAGWLLANPAAQVVLVGHTDASGALQGNIALSRARAQVVRQVLIETLGVPETQVSAEGVGFLSPRATNLTEEGRQKNRRVEAVLTSTR